MGLCGAPAIVAKPVELTLEREGVAPCVRRCVFSLQVPRRDGLALRFFPHVAARLASGSAVQVGC